MKITDVLNGQPVPEYGTLNQDGLWCDICGELIAAPWNLEEDFEAPQSCPKCGWPDEFDPDKV